MSERITTLLDLVRLETGAIQPRIDLYALDELVGSVLHRLEQPLRRHRVRIELPDSLPLLRVDGRLIEQVLENLLDNAAKYTPAGSEIRISAQALSRQVEVSIEDDGPGLPGADPEILFEKFQRGTPEGAVGGIGLGLAICRTILALHKGRIWAENRAPHGAALRFTLPLLLPKPTRRAGGARSGDIARLSVITMTIASRAVLVVEDEPQLRRVLRTLLELENFRVIEADSAERGLAEARTHKPDLLIIDLGLPDRDGTEVITGVRSWSRVPIIVLSARSDESDKVAALDAGADDYITKPFGARELSARVQVALRHTASAGAAGAVLQIGVWRVDLKARTARDDGAGELHLTPTEYRLLEVLAQHIGMVVTHRTPAAVQV